MNVAPDAWKWPRAAEPLPVGHTLGPVPEVLFKRIEMKDFEGTT